MRIETAPPTAPIEVPSPIPFGRCFTPNMAVAEYVAGQGWGEARVVARKPFELDPATTSLHYGQAIFEGLKAHRQSDGSLALFRPDAHGRRFMRSATRLAIPPYPAEEFVTVMREYCEVEQAAMPEVAGGALYIRPFIFATDVLLGVKPSDTYLFVTIACVVGDYFAGGGKPVRVWVSDTYTRAAPGGMGFAKTPGNYAASLSVQQEAMEAGFDQVLWLDAARREYVEEMGGMNIFFVVDGSLVTPPNSDSILAGITRDSLIRLATDGGLRVEERPIRIAEVMEGIASGRVAEAFAAGTAAVVTEIGEFGWKGQTAKIPGAGQPGRLSERLRKELVDIQTGRGPDPYGWRVAIRRQARVTG